MSFNGGIIQTKIQLCHVLLNRYFYNPHISIHRELDLDGCLPGAWIRTHNGGSKVLKQHFVSQSMGTVIISR
jgi:hypothetical protein